MPLVNIYVKGNDVPDSLKKVVPELKKFLAEKLTCGDISLSPSEVSVRFLNVADGDMIAPIEVEIAAHAFPERVTKQDEFCLEAMDYIKQQAEVEDVKVWLKLSELGHSWD
jgi:hypothetical protein